MAEFASLYTSDYWLENALIYIFYDLNNSSEGVDRLNGRFMEVISIY
jgi:hypothetical protein